jgi:hypothetical protein
MLPGQWASLQGFATIEYQRLHLVRNHGLPITEGNSSSVYELLLWCAAEFSLPFVPLCRYSSGVHAYVDARPSVFGSDSVIPGAIPLIESSL